MMVGQPVKIAVRLTCLDFVVAHGLDTFRMSGKGSFPGLPCGFSFDQVSFVIQKSRVSHTFIAPMEWKVRHQVVAADKTIIGTMVKISKRRSPTRGEPYV